MFIFSDRHTRQPILELKWCWEPSYFFNLDYRNFVWIHVFFTMDRIINANRWISLWSPVDKKRYIVSIISRWNGLVFIRLCNLPCHWMSTTSCRIICWIEFIFLISLYTDSEFALWSRKLRFIRLGLKIFVDGIPRYLFVKSYNEAQTASLKTQLDKFQWRRDSKRWSPRPIQKSKNDCRTPKRSQKNQRKFSTNQGAPGESESGSWRSSSDVTDSDRTDFVKLITCCVNFNWLFSILNIPRSTLELRAKLKAKNRRNSLFWTY